MTRARASSNGQLERAAHAASRQGHCERTARELRLVQPELAGFRHNIEAGWNEPAVVIPFGRERRKYGSTGRVVSGLLTSCSSELEDWMHCTPQSAVGMLSVATPGAGPDEWLRTQLRTPGAAANGEACLAASKV
jgi:hypothetical protein